MTIWLAAYKATRTRDPFLIHFGCLLKNKSFTYLVVKFDN